MGDHAVWRPSPPSWSHRPPRGEPPFGRLSL